MACASVQSGILPLAVVGTAKGKTNEFIAGAYDCVPTLWQGISAAMCNWSYEPFTIN
jgi:hypothetical protein